MNILLAAHAQGLGAVWLGIHPIEDRVAGISQLFNLPPTIKPLSLIALGHPKELMPIANRYKKSRVHINKW
jgi:nitroreductase